MDTFIQEPLLPPFSPTYHFVLEVLAYAVGMRLFLWQRRQNQTTPTLNQTGMGWVAAGAILGAALGSKLLFWLHRPDIFLERWHDPTMLMGGKTIAGGLLGGVIGVELAKHWCRIKHGTGDLFVLPVMVGMIIGRLGCFFGGLHDMTYGQSTNLPWGVDFGDGMLRHPTQLYEVLFLLICLPLIRRSIPRVPRAGDGFRLFMTLYCLWRLFIEFWKPQPFVYPIGLTGIQLGVLAGLVYYGPQSLRILRNLRPPSNAITQIPTNTEVP